MANIWKKSVLFAAGGCSYMGIELLWRGWTHSSMFLAGGSSFLLLGKLNQLKSVPLAVRMLSGAGAITGVELITGLLTNRDHSVWDYRHVPFNYRGQICLPFCLLWVPVSLFGMTLYGALDKQIPPVK